MFDIVMPLYNKEKFVEEAVCSVLSQAYENWRLFVVDDGSTDRSAELVRNHPDPRITLIQQSNEGVGPARNAAIRAGRSEWIAFLDADDVWATDHLAELDALRTEFADAALIGCAFRRFRDTLARPSMSRAPVERRLARYFAESARGSELLVTSSAAVPRALIERIGPFEDLPGNEDVELWVRLALNGPVAVSSRATVYYRVDTGGITDGGMGDRKPKTRPVRREELSSTITPLERALPNVADERLREDIIAYMDSRIGIRVASAVLEGDILYARQLLSLFDGAPRGQARTAALIARLPVGLAKSVIGVRRGLKRLVGNSKL